MILVRNIRLPLSAAEPQAFEKALHTLRVPRSKVEHTGVAKLSFVLLFELTLSAQ